MWYGHYRSIRTIQKQKALATLANVYNNGTENDKTVNRCGARRWLLHWRFDRMRSLIHSWHNGTDGQKKMQRWRKSKSSEDPTPKFSSSNQQEPSMPGCAKKGQLSSIDHSGAHICTTGSMFGRATWTLSNKWPAPKAASTPSQVSFLLRPYATFSQQFNP